MSQACCEDESFSIVAEIVKAIPFGIGEVAGGLLEGIAELYKKNIECKRLSAQLPTRVSLFGAYVKEVKPHINPQCTFAVPIFSQFADLLEEIQTDLRNFCKRSKLNLLAPIQYAAKFKNHVKALQELHTRLGEAVNLHVLRAVMSQNSAQTQAQVMDELKHYAHHLMTELDSNGDGTITLKELWDHPSIQFMFTTDGSLENLVHRLLDQNGDGVLDENEVLILATALKKISDLFYSIKPDFEADTVSCELVVSLLHSIDEGYGPIRVEDIREVADLSTSPPLPQQTFWWYPNTQEFFFGYEGFLRFYLHVINKHQLWAVVKRRLGS